MRFVIVSPSSVVIDCGVFFAISLAPSHLRLHPSLFATFARLCALVPRLILRQGKGSGDHFSRLSLLDKGRLYLKALFCNVCGVVFWKGVEEVGVPSFVAMSGGVVTVCCLLFLCLVQDVVGVQCG